MQDSEAASKPRGIFDRSTKGHQMPTVSVEVERGQIRFFAKALGETDPIHFDIDAAQAAGFPDVVATPSFFMPIEAMADEERARLGQPSLIKLLRCDFGRLLHGDETYTYHGLVFAGDVVQFDTKITDFYEKKGGLMEFVTIESTVSHAKRGVLITATRTLLHRLG
ncbi:MaoC family dehydratase N-terminal domain-containing protein [Blastomonas sp. CCH2-E1]|uniref:MaoC family dehydratase N-terminal domain-containing protein n=1 Tax=Blastomonas sp. CCH2-E1 TaxID=1768740 RepID=UPI0009EB3580|nr:MaoC family dehydratase N-terminal domain-containing protein [Blastomonas sp. CCH2-E1]